MQPNTLENIQSNFKKIQHDIATFRGFRNSQIFFNLATTIALWLLLK